MKKYIISSVSYFIIARYVGSRSIRINTHSLFFLFHNLYQQSMEVPHNRLCELISNNLHSAVIGHSSIKRLSIIQNCFFVCLLWWPMLHAGYNGRPSGPSQVWSGQGTLTWYFGWSWYFLLNNSYLINFFLDYYNYLFYQLINFFICHLVKKF